MQPVFPRQIGKDGPGIRIGRARHFIKNRAINRLYALQAVWVLKRECQNQARVSGKDLRQPIEPRLAAPLQNAVDD